MDTLGTNLGALDLLRNHTLDEIRKQVSQEKQILFFSELNGAFVQLNLKILFKAIALLPVGEDPVFALFRRNVWNSPLFSSFRDISTAEIKEWKNGLSDALSHHRFDLSKIYLTSWFAQLLPESEKNWVVWAICLADAVDLLPLLKNHGYYLDYQNWLEQTPLIFSVMNQMKPLMETLLAFAVDVNKVDRRGMSALHHACSLNDEEAVGLLLQHDVLMDSQDNSGRTALYIAVESLNILLVKKLLDKRANPKICNRNFQSPFLYAVKKGHSEIACLLLEYGADFDSAGRSLLPAHYAAERGLLDVLQAMKENGADLTCKDCTGETPLYKACIARKKEVVEFLLSTEGVTAKEFTKTGFLEIHAAALSGSIEIFDLFMQRNVDPNTPNSIGAPPFLLACEMGHLDLVYYLIDQLKVDPTLCSDDGNTLLHYAASNDYLDLFRKYADRFDSLYRKNNKGRTPFHIAAGNGSAGIFQFLLEKENHLNTSDHEGKTCAHLIGSNGQQALVPFLMDYRANLNVRDRKGYTPLEYAAHNEHYEIAISFIQMGAQIPLDSIHCESMLRFLAAEGYNSLYLQFLECGVDPCSEGHFGNNAFQCALVNNRCAFVKKLIKDFPDALACLESHGLGALLPQLCESPDKFCRENGLILPFLLGDSKLAGLIAHAMDDKTFFRACDFLAEQFPEGAIDRVICSRYALKSEHLLLGKTEVAIPLPPEGELSSVKDLFERINFDHPDRPCYRQVADDEGRIHDRHSLEEGLNRFIEVIEDRLDITGAPKKGSSKYETFFQNLERGYKHVIHKLKLSEDRDLRDEKIIEMALISPHCAGGFYATMMQMYLQLCDESTHERGSFSENIQIFLRKLRLRLVEGLVSRSNPHNAHEYNAFLSFLHEEIGFDASSEFDDIYRNMSGVQTREAALSSLNSAYTPEIILRNIEYEIHSVDPDKFLTLEMFVDWCKQILYLDWRENPYSALATEIEQMIAKKAQHEEIEAYCKERGLSLDGRRPMQAIVEDGQHEFLSTLFDMQTGKIKKSCLLQLLVHQGVLKIGSRTGSISHPLDQSLIQSSIFDLLPDVE